MKKYFKEQLLMNGFKLHNFNNNKLYYKIKRINKYKTISEDIYFIKSEDGWSYHWSYDVSFKIGSIYRTIRTVAVYTPHKSLVHIIHDIRDSNKFSLRDNVYYHVGNNNLSIVQKEIEYIPKDKWLIISELMYKKIIYKLRDVNMDVLNNYI